MNFTAIDFETATNACNSACAVGIVTVENGQITDTYYSLIRPPENQYSWHNIQVHGIKPEETAEAKPFAEIFISDPVRFACGTRAFRPDGFPPPVK